MANENYKNVTYQSLKNLFEKLINEIFTHKLSTEEISINQNDLSITKDGIFFNKITIGELEKKLSNAEITEKLSDNNYIIINNPTNKIVKVTTKSNNILVSNYFLPDEEGKVIISSDFLPYEEISEGYAIEIYNLNVEKILSLENNQLTIKESTLTSDTIDKANNISYMSINDLDSIVPSST